MSRWRCMVEVLCDPQAAERHAVALTGIRLPSRAHRRLREQSDRAEVLALHRQGVHPRAIAAALDIAPDVVSQLLEAKSPSAGHSGLYAQLEGRDGGSSAPDPHSRLHGPISGLAAHPCGKAASQPKGRTE